MDRLIDPESRGDLVRQTADAARQALGRPGRDGLQRPRGGARHRAARPFAKSSRSPRRSGACGRWTDVELSDVWPHLDLKTLFRLHWGGKGVKDEAWEELQRDEFLPRLARMQREAIEQGLAAAAGSATATSRPTATATTWSSSARTRQEREIARFTFPRQPRRERLCLADYFLPLVVRTARRRRLPDRDRRRRGDRADRAAASGRRVQRELLHAMA